MKTCPDLRILFLSSFSDACFRSARCIAQIADACHVSLTIAHVTDSASATIRSRTDLDSFFAEADHYDECRRMLIESDDTVGAIAALCDNQSYDLIVAPSSDRVGVHKFFKRSLRAQLVKHCRAPLWTVGNCLDRSVPKARLQLITCLLDFDAPAHPHIRLAGALAARTGAKLRVAAVLPPVHEGRLVDAIHSRTPLMPEVAFAAIRRSFPSDACPEIDVAVGESGSEIPRMLRRCDSDMVFVGPGQALSGLLRPRLSSWLDRLPCPAVCVDGGSADFDEWSFQRPQQEFHAAARPVEAA